MTRILQKETLFVVWTIACIQVGKLHIYFGNNDGWSPLAYRDNLLQNIPEIARGDAVIDTLDIPHAFVEFHSEVTANIVADWIKRLEGDKD